MSTQKTRQQNQQKGPIKDRTNQLDDLDQIAVTMDAILRQRLPDGTIQRGILAGREPDIRQTALIQSIGGFLHSNESYIKARKTHNIARVKGAMIRCGAISLKYAKARLARELSRESKRFTVITEANGGFYLHPSTQKPNEWPSAEKASMIMTSVRVAVREGILSPANAGLVHMACENGMSVNQIARLVGISPSAVSQQFRRIRRVLPDVIERVEQTSFE